MTAKNTSRRLALLAAVLSVLMLLSFTVIPGFAEDATEAEGTVNTEATTEGVTEADGTTAETTAGTTAGTSAETTAGTTAETTTTDDDEGMSDEDVKRLVINLGVGAVILLAAVALIIVFRKKIPGYIKALKSECGKIVWCPKDKLKKNTIVVLVTILVLAVAIGIMDFAFSRGIMLLRDLFH